MAIIDAERGIVSVKPRRKKVAIVAGSRSREYAPYNDDKWEIWGLNEMILKRSERHFEMHPLSVCNDYELEFLYHCREPVYLIRLSRNVPMGVRYPIERVLAMEGAREYFTCTFAYQIALALLEGFEEIGFFANLPLGSPRERTIERSCVEWWLGFAAGKGVKITMPEESDLAKHTYFYGYDYFSEKVWTGKVIKDLGLQILLRNNEVCKIIYSSMFDAIEKNKDETRTLDI